MRIIAGTARNLELAAVPDCEVRPTAVRARKALFDSLGSWSNLVVLDLFSGTGALALEAASRGAARIVMVENDPAHQACIRENCRRVAASGAGAEMLLAECDAMRPERYLDRLTDAPDIVFADPPYAMRAHGKILSLIKRFDLLECGGMVVFEHDSSECVTDEDFNADTRKCGTTALTFLSKKEVLHLLLHHTQNESL